MQAVIANSLRRKGRRFGEEALRLYGSHLAATWSTGESVLEANTPAMWGCRDSQPEPARSDLWTRSLINCAAAVLRVRF